MRVRLYLSVVWLSICSLLSLQLLAWIIPQSEGLVVKANLVRIERAYTRAGHASGGRGALAERVPYSSTYIIA
jgi:hypothetical protein